MRLVDITSVGLSRHSTEWLCLFVLCELIGDPKLARNICVLQESSVHFLCIDELSWSCRALNGFRYSPNIWHLVIALRGVEKYLKVKVISCFESAHLLSLAYALHFHLKRALHCLTGPLSSLHYVSFPS